MTDNGFNEVRFRRKLSVSHFLAANKFANQCVEVEEKHKELPTKDAIEELMGFSIGSIICSVAFLEAIINELFDDARENLLDDVSKELREVLSEAWSLESVTNLSVLDKYQLSLLLSRKPIFDRGKSPYQDISLLISLRNKLVHTKAAWNLIPPPIDQNELKKIERDLKSRFQENKLLVDSHFPYFPDRCLGAGCANWAVDSSAIFFKEFCDKMGITRFESRGYDVWQFRKV